MLFGKVFSVGTDDIDHIPAFPGPATLYRTRDKYLGQLAVGAGVVGMCAYAIAMHYSPGWLFWLNLVLFAFALVIFSIGLLFPSLNRLTLGPVDFETVGLRYRLRVKWEDTEGFFPCYEPFESVVYDNPRKAGGPIRPCGHKFGLPDTYGLAAPELADLMNRWRAQALAAQTAPIASNGRAGLAGTA